MINKRRRIALVAPGLQYGGGVPSMTAFLHRVIQAQANYEVDLFSLAMSARDGNSVQLTVPQSWFKGVSYQSGEWRGWPVTFVGAIGSELETQRMKPRAILDRLLSRYDLVQIVAGTPAWGLAVSQVTTPRCLYVATTIAEERRSVLRQVTGWRCVWSQLMTSWNVRLEPKSLQTMDHVFSLSPYTKQQMDRFVAEEKHSLAYPGIDTTVFFPAEIYAADGPLISVGRFNDPRKNFPLLLAAYRDVRQNCSASPPLLLVGTPPATSDWKLAELWGLTPHIQVVGEKSPIELADLYRQASLFVLASDEEGLGIVILEAMACGLPVVSTRSGGPESCVQDGITGYLTPIRDAEIMTKSILSLINEPERRRKFGAAGQGAVEQTYSLEAAGAIFLSVYDHLLTQSARGSN